MSNAMFCWLKFSLKLHLRESLPSAKHVVANLMLVGSKPSPKIPFEESFAFGLCRVLIVIFGDVELLRLYSK